MNTENVVKLLDNLEVATLPGDEEINQDLYDTYIGLFEQLVLSDNISMLVTQLASIDSLKANAATKCAIMYAVTTFISEAVKAY